MALGDGTAFAAGKSAIMKKEGYNAKRAAAIMASAGVRKYGQKRMSRWAKAGKAKAGD